MGKAKELMTQWRIWVLVLAVFSAVWAINPMLDDTGVIVGSVEPNSSAEINGVGAGETLLVINGANIMDLSDFEVETAKVAPGDIVKLNSKQRSYAIIADEDGSLGFTVKPRPTSNLKKGLDLIGGVRVILKPNQDISDQQMTDVVDLIIKRLNVYGVSDIVARPTKDLEGNKYILIEIAGASEEEVAKLVSQQGKFEAKIKNETIFVGGEDIKSVCRSAECSGINIQNGCGQSQDGTWVCTFSFQVDVSQESAERHAAATRGLSTTLVGNNRYLSEKLGLYLDEEMVSDLYISTNLQGIEATSFVIQGPGAGATREAAIEDALLSMKEMQTVLITGSLPVKLEVAKMDVVSPTLGEEFFASTLKALVVALVAVGAFLFVRYRNIKIALPMFLTGLSEVVIILGFAALIRWNLDLAAIAGILAAVGTGVDDQIVIADEIISGEKISLEWKKRIKRAFFIIFAAYATTVVAMMPLWAMGAGLLRGFALTTIVGVSIGVFITRPAYAKIVEIFRRE